MHFSPTITQKLINQGWSVAVTGAGGWMGSALLEMLYHAYGAESVSRVAAFTSTPRRIGLRNGTHIDTRSIDELPHPSPLPKGQGVKWLLAHCAYGTKDKVVTQGNDVFVSANDKLTETVTKAVEKLRPEAFFFPSSGAVYAKDGSLDTDMEKNPYGVQKHQDEKHFLALSERLGMRICIPRVFTMSGPYINKWQAYAIADFILQARQGKNIQINSPGAVMRSYMHVRDILELSFACLLDASLPSPVCFDTYGVNVEMAELATAIERELLGEQRSMLRKADPAQAGSHYIGKPQPMGELCTRYNLALTPLPKQIADTAAYIAQTSAMENAA